MADVLVALLPAAVWACWLFGWRAALLLAVFAFFAGRSCERDYLSPGQGAGMRVTLTLYDEAGRPVCRSDRVVRQDGRQGRWECRGSLAPAERNGSYVLTVQEETGEKR